MQNELCPFNQYKSCKYLIYDDENIHHKPRTDCTIKKVERFKKMCFLCALITVKVTPRLLRDIKVTICLPDKG